MQDNEEKKEENEWLTFPHVVGMIFLIWFGIVGSLTYIVPCARYHSSDDPLFGEKTKVNAKFDALHWLTALGPIIVGVVSCFSNHIYWTITCFICCFGGLLWVTCYISYVVLFFTSTEWKQTYEVISFDDFQKLNQRWINSPAEFWVYGTARRSSRKGGGTRCETENPFVIRPGESKDFSELLPLTREHVKGRAIRLRTIMNVKTNSDGEKVIQSVENGVRRCLEMSSEDIHTFDTRTMGAVSGYKEYLMITENGKKPQSLWRGAAGTGGFFAAGIVYLYDLARVSPVVNYELYKECNITETPIVPCDPLGSRTYKG